MDGGREVHGETVNRSIYILGKDTKIKAEELVWKEWGEGFRTYFNTAICGGEEVIEWRSKQHCLITRNMLDVYEGTVGADGLGGWPLSKALFSELRGVTVEGEPHTAIENLKSRKWLGTVAQDGSTI